MRTLRRLKRTIQNICRRYSRSDIVVRRGWCTCIQGRASSQSGVIPKSRLTLPYPAIATLNTLCKRWKR
jgi:hypothetical protein